jgi:hypothetical protein
VGREVIDIDDLHDAAVVVGQQLRFGLGQNAERARLLDLAGQVEGGQAPGLLPLDA